ncbi:rhamnogalacturonan lyase family protein [Roseimarinus sediminis]|uniref:rhamnogalacturonan lyase family protein n=1 Tax=Roseimarinus sediminis TaxID=1610899 RepID=UPI003D2554C7
MNIYFKITSLLISILLLFSLNTSQAQRQVERLNRGLVAVSTDQGVFLSWRLLGTDDEQIAFDVYRDHEKINESPITDKTNYIDAGGTSTSLYHVKTVNSTEEVSDMVSPWTNNFLEIPLQTPAGYEPNDCSTGDLDGDGIYELVVKMTKDGKDNSQSGITGQPKLEAYKLDGTLMWRIDLGINIRCGAHYTQFLVYDFDSDGMAEVVCKTADGTTDALGNVIGDATKDYRNASGYILEGPEYLTVFNGLTGKAESTVDYLEPRGVVGMWGDTYGNRVDRFLAGVAYLDGIHPSIIMTRGYYTGNWNGASRGKTSIAAWDYKDGQLQERWHFKADLTTGENADYTGQGTHSLSVNDVDADGKDEIVYGACTIDDDGNGLYTTRLHHGDALHVSDFDPERPGLEVLQPHEDKVNGLSFRDAATGAIIWQHKSNQDVGRALIADIMADHPGAESWASAGLGVYNAKGEQVSTNRPSINFAIWWDGDLLRELLDGTSITKYGGGTLLNASGCTSNNGTKKTPALSADLLGDWREEVVFRTTDNQKLRIYTTTQPSEHRIYTLMHDPQYRTSIAWQNAGYNQPPHTSFFLGHGMAEAPRQNIWAASGDGNPTVYITEPVNNSVKALGLPVNVAISASDYGETLDGVELYLNDDFLVKLSDLPYSYQIEGLSTGSYTIKAIALDADGNSTTSAPVTFSVDEGKPHVELIEPVSGSMYGRNSTIRLLAEASDSDGEIVKVSFMVNDQPEGEVNSAPYELELHNLPSGKYMIQAIAYDNLNNSTASEIVSIEVGSSMIIQEMTTGYCGVDGIELEDKNAGFTGAGYANTDNETGKGINWRVSIPEASEYTINWRYAGTSDRPGKLLLNGEELAQLPFTSTGDWTNWNENALDIDLPRGVVELRLEATGADGLPNIDYLEIKSTQSASDPIAVDCGTPLTTVDHLPALNAQLIAYQQSSGSIVISLQNSRHQLESVSFMSMTGQRLQQLDVDAFEIRLEPGTLPKGLYLIHAKTSTRTYPGRIIIR